MFQLHKQMLNMIYIFYILLQYIVDSNNLDNI